MWSSDKLVLEDKNDVSRRFFVRVEGSVDEWQEQIINAFGMVQFVKAEGVDGEFGFVTEKMPEGVYEEKAKECPAVIKAMIRVED